MAHWDDMIRIEQLFPDHTEVKFLANDVVFPWWAGDPLYDWLNSKDAEGFYAAHQGVADEHGDCQMRFLFSHPNTAFEFRFRLA